MINNHPIDRSYIRFDNNLSSPPTFQSHHRESSGRWSLYRVAKVTLTALGLLFSTQQLTHISERRQLALQRGLQSRNISHPLESDIRFWLSCPPLSVDKTSPVTDVFLQHNNNHSIPTHPDSDESRQADIDEILPDLKHLFDQTFDQTMCSTTHDKGSHTKQHHHKNSKEHNARMGWLYQLSPQPSQLPQCNLKTSHEYTSQNTLTTSALNLLTTHQPSPTVVAVIDSGIIRHSALNDRLVPGYDFISDPECAGDENGYDNIPTDEGNFTRLPPPWHGTRVAGIIAGASVNKDGVSPLQNIIKIQPIRYLGRHSRCNETDDDFINALKWAAGIPVANVPLNTNPAKVINLSIGEMRDCAPFETVFKALYQRNVTVIAGAGNEAIPASNICFSKCPHVIAVGAQLTESLLASYSNFGPPIAISAIVGEGVTTTSNTGKAIPLADSFTKARGTSAAAALVSQAAALMHSVNSRLTPDDIRAILMNTSRPFQTPAWRYIADSKTTLLSTKDNIFSTKGSPKRCSNAYCGSGHLDIGKAVAFAAAKALEQSGDQLSSEFQWADDLPTIMLNGSLIIILSALPLVLLLVNGPEEKLQTIAHRPRQIITPEEATRNTVNTSVVMMVDDGMILRSGKQLQRPSVNTPKGMLLKSGKRLPGVDA
ncbi:S8 family serine peptidase [Endozoicomonas sp. YOMI1]|uniref:S8 family serine peptidase n=1 Tax=Endozoicomonas sp. YOMI1 TaxID=2828739 RepID=UPI0021490645|nr:S8 family serine peptidase [Endozoicomonas sp. YOMI1]